MAWDIAVDGFKAAIAGVLTAVGIWLRKNFIPTVKALKKFSALLDRVQLMENRLRKLELLHDALNDIDKHPIFKTNSKGEVIYVNAAWCDMTGLQARDALNLGYMAVIAEENIGLVERENERLVKHPGSFSGKIIFRHATKGYLINTWCRSEVLRMEENGIETIGRLYIIT